MCEVACLCQLAVTPWFHFSITLFLKYLLFGSGTKPLFATLRESRQSSAPSAPSPVVWCLSVCMCTVNVITERGTTSNVRVRARTPSTGTSLTPQTHFNLFLTRPAFKTSLPAATAGLADGLFLAEVSAAPATHQEKGTDVEEKGTKLDISRTASTLSSADSQNSQLLVYRHERAAEDRR